MTVQPDMVAQQEAAAPVAASKGDDVSRSRATEGALKVGLLPVLLVAAVVLFAVLEPRFLSGDNGINLSRQLSFLLLLAMAQMLVLLTPRW